MPQAAPVIAAIAGVAARTTDAPTMNNSGNAIGISPNLPFNFM